MRRVIACQGNRKGLELRITVSFTTTVWKIDNVFKLNKHENTLNLTLPHIDKVFILQQYELTEVSGCQATQKGLFDIYYTNTTVIYEWNCNYSIW